MIFKLFFTFNQFPFKQLSFLMPPESYGELGIETAAAMR